MSTWTVIGYVNGNRLPAIAATRYVAGPYDNKRAALRVFEEWRRGLLGDLERIELREDGRVVEQVQRENASTLH